LPQDDDLTAHNTPGVISSIFTEEVTEEAVNDDPLGLFP